MRRLSLPVKFRTMNLNKIRILLFAGVTFLASCTEEVSICSCKNNDFKKEPSASLKEKCLKYQASWEAKYNAGSDSLKKAMDLEFESEIGNCR